MKEPRKISSTGYGSKEVSEAMSLDFFYTIYEKDFEWEHR